MSQYSKSSKNGNVSTRLLTGSVLLLGVICLGLWGLALYRSGYFSNTPTALNSTLTPAATSNSLSCEDLINAAMRISSNSCDHIGLNQVCYGNITIHADLLPDTSQRFAMEGDKVDVGLVQRLSTAPLDLVKNEWGIAVFNLIANLPRSLPGEAVKMVVFGNTTIGNNEGQDIQSFYFSSELGQIVCDKVPFDGIMITMPDGTGVKLRINGSELTLMGNASLQATKNGNMEVGLLSGLASITAQGQTQYFTAGQKVEVALGGANGTEAISGPSQPTSLSPEVLKIACTLSGIGCLVTAISTIDPLIAQATLNASLSATPNATGLATSIIFTASNTPFYWTATPQPQATQVKSTPEPVKTKIPPGLLKKTATPIK